VKKKTRLTAIIILVLLFSTVAGTMLVTIGRANPLPGIDQKIMISTPQYATYNGNRLTINFSAAYNWKICSLLYSLDDNKMQSVTSQVVSQEDANIGKNPMVIRTTLNCSCFLSNLAEGWHKVTFYFVASGKFNLGFESYEKGDVIDSASTTFKIDNTPPEVSILSPLNKTYDSSNISMNFKVNEVVSSIEYSLDKGENIIIAGNTTLTGLHDGKHNVTVYAWDEAGNMGASDTGIFSIAKPEPEPELKSETASSSTMLAIVSTGTVSVVGLGLLVYFKKRKHLAEMVGSK